MATAELATYPTAYCSARKAAAYCGLSERTVWRLIRDHKLPFHRVGRRVLIKYDDLDEMICRDR